MWTSDDSGSDVNSMTSEPIERMTHLQWGKDVFVNRRRWGASGGRVKERSDQQTVVYWFTRHTSGESEAHTEMILFPRIKRNWVSHSYVLSKTYIRNSFCTPAARPSTRVLTQVDMRPEASLKGKNRNFCTEVLLVTHILLRPISENLCRQSDASANSEKGLHHEPVPEMWFGCRSILSQHLIALNFDMESVFLGNIWQIDLWIYSGRCISRWDLWDTTLHTNTSFADQITVWTPYQTEILSQNVFQPWSIR